MDSGPGYKIQKQIYSLCFQVVSLISREASADVRKDHKFRDDSMREGESVRWIKEAVYMFVCV